MFVNCFQNKKQQKQIIHKQKKRFLLFPYLLECQILILLCFLFSFRLPLKITNKQVYYYIVDSPRNEGKEFFEINLQSGEIFTKVVFDREKQGAYALEVEARDGAPSARPNSNGQPNSGMYKLFLLFFIKY